MYQPGNVPLEPQALAGFLRLELQRIAQEFTDEREFLKLKTLYSAPSRIEEGMVIRADGTTFNPGAGAGIYARIAGAWVKL